MKNLKVIGYIKIASFETQPALLNSAKDNSHCNAKQPVESEVVFAPRGRSTKAPCNRRPFCWLKDARGATSEKDMPQWHVPQGRADDTIVFESRFESGNLRSAERM